MQKRDRINCFSARNGDYPLPEELMKDRLSYSCRPAPGIPAAEGNRILISLPRESYILSYKYRTCLCLDIFFEGVRKVFKDKRLRALRHFQKGSSAIEKRRDAITPEASKREFSNERGEMQLFPCFGSVYGSQDSPSSFDLRDCDVLSIVYRTCLCHNICLSEPCKCLYLKSLSGNCPFKKGVLQFKRGEMELLSGPRKGRTAIKGEFYNCMVDAYV